jgi:hypothetical protein
VSQSLNGLSAFVAIRLYFIVISPFPIAAQAFDHLLFQLLTLAR